MLTTVKLALIFLAILISAYWSGIDYVAMRRESDRPIPVQAEIVLSLDQALNLSLAAGDGRRVNWEAVGF